MIVTSFLNGTADPGFPPPAGYETYKQLWNPWANANDEVAYYYGKIFGKALSLNTRKKLGEVILPLYQEKVASGKYPPFELLEGKTNPARPTESAKLAREIEEETGYEYSFIWNYLTSLESLAKTGYLDLKHYDPGKADLQTLTEAHPMDTVTDFFSKVPGAIANVTDKLPATIEKGTNKILIIAAIGAGVYTLFTVSKFIPKPK